VSAAARGDAAVVAALSSSDPGERLAALEELSASPRPLDGALALAVIGCLGGPEKALQRRATDVLRMGNAAAEPALVERLRAACAAADPRLRWGAAYALGQIGVVEPDLVPALLEALASRDGDQRWAAAELLVASARAHQDRVVPALLAALGEGGPECRKMVLYVLRDLGLAAPGAVAAFVERMADPDAGVRHAALSGLVRLEPAPAEASDLVLAMLRGDPDPGVRRAAASALGRVGRGPEVASALETAAASDDPGLRRAAETARRLLATR
jgi:HEAT repeat protein